MAITEQWLLDKANRKLNASGMDKDVARITREVIKEMYKQGILVGVAQAYRSKAEQDALYAKGRRGIPGEKIVTNAKGGQSNHNFGVAVDLFQYDKDGEAIFESGTTRYNKIVAAMKKRGMEWGGDWSGSFKDYPHFQLYDRAAGKSKPSTSKPTPAPAPSSSGTYKVKSGDTLSEIAADHKISVANLKSWNKLKSDLIKPGDVLKVKKPAAAKPKPTGDGKAIVKYPGKVYYKGQTGMTKENIERIQRAVKAEVTGKYDDQTVKAVKAYQARKKLKADGETGPATWNMMF